MSGGVCPRDDNRHPGAVPIGITRSFYRWNQSRAALPEEGLSSTVLRQLRCRHPGTPLTSQLSSSRAAGAVNKGGEEFQGFPPSWRHRLVAWPVAAPRLCGPPWGQRGPDTPASAAPLHINILEAILVRGTHSRKAWDGLDQPSSPGS